MWYGDASIRRVRRGQYRLLMPEFDEEEVGPVIEALEELGVEYTVETRNEPFPATQRTRGPAVKTPNCTRTCDLVF